METTFIFDRPVTGKDNIGRKSETALLVKSIRSGSNVAIYEPAKSGKTSVVRQALLDVRQNGSSPVSIECSLLGIRSSHDFISRVSSAISGIFANTPSEREELCGKYLGAKFGDGSEEQFKSVLHAPYRLAQDRGTGIVMVFDEFQDILLVDDAEKKLRWFEEVIRDAEDELWSRKCSFIWCGSQVNSMKRIFENLHFCRRVVERIRLGRIPYADFENFILKKFLSSGKVIEKEAVRATYDKLGGSPWYLNHFCAICNGLSRGFITGPVVQESITSLLSIHRPRFISTMHDLTTFQTLLLKAVIDGEILLSSSAVIERYGLNSSANVHRIKESLCKKEIITFEDGEGAIILDPLFEYWLREYYFIGTGTQTRGNSSRY